MTTKKKVVKWEDFTPVERAIIVLAQYVQRCPYNGYRVEQAVLDELGYEREKSLKAKGDKK